MLKNAKRTGARSNITYDIAPMEDPQGAIDYYMPLPDEVYKRWNKK